jgi:hypothetical protein
MDFRYERIQGHVDGCLQQAGLFHRSVEGAQLFENEIVHKSKQKWLVIAAGISEAEAGTCFSEAHKRERAVIPIQINPSGQLSLLLIIRPLGQEALSTEGKYVTDFSRDVGPVELYQGCYVRADGLPTPTVQQIRWELDPVAGHKEPHEKWLLPWAGVVGCNPAHPPSHWHINSPAIELPGRRQRRRVVNPPELRLAVGLPNPLLLMLSLANWLGQTGKE